MFSYCLQGETSIVNIVLYLGHHDFKCIQSPPFSFAQSSLKLLHKLLCFSLQWKYIDICVSMVTLNDFIFQRGTSISPCHMCLSVTSLHIAKQVMYRSTELPMCTASITQHDHSAFHSKHKKQHRDKYHVSLTAVTHCNR